MTRASYQSREDIRELKFDVSRLWAATKFLEHCIEKIYLFLIDQNKFLKTDKQNTRFYPSF
jgi:hypothetical protein